jgi:hypothetical protein
MLLYAWPGVISILLFAALATYAPMAPLWNARLLPFIYLCFLLIAAYGAAEVVRVVVGMLHAGVRLPAKFAYIGIIVVMVGSTVWASYERRATPASWAQYNYEGYEAKSGWPDAKALFAALSALPPGRIMWEFNRDYERFGTTRTLENVPIFTGHPTMEGLLIESSLNAPFHFINQAETSETQTDAVPGITYPSFDFPTGLRHLRMYGVRWFVAYTDRAKQAARGAGLVIRQTVPQSGGHSFAIYEIGDGHLVEVPPYRPVLFADRDWRRSALDWYRDLPLLDTPLVFTGGGDKVAKRQFADPGPVPATGMPATLPREPLNQPGEIADAHMVGNEELDFTTDRVGEPHVVKVSWFPNWKALGAEGPWMLSPGLMVVVPTQAHVRLVYRDTPVDKAGKALSLVGLGVLAWPAVASARRRRRPATGVQGE